MNVNQDKLQDFIKDLNKTFEKLVKIPKTKKGKCIKDETQRTLLWFEHCLHEH